METFGCCSKYLVCSNRGECCYKDDAEFAGCQYRRNLEAGRIFYGERAFQSPQVLPVEAPVIDNIYLFSDSRLFRILRKEKNGHSYSLTKEQIALLLSAFDAQKIPYKTAIDEDSCSIETPSNCRVFFEIDGQSFHILNFNSWLMYSKYADRIVAALKAKGIHARTEIMGSYAQSYVPYEFKPKPKPIEYEAKKPVYEQISLFDIAI